MKNSIIAIAAAASLAAMPAAAAPPEELVGAPAANAGLQTVSIYEFFRADGDPGQCNDRAHGEIVTAYDRWSDPIRIDADNRSGGCQFNFAVVDPQHKLAAWHATMTFAATGDGGQCGGQGTQDVQIVRAATVVDNGRAVRIDTDDRSGGCRLSFSVRGPGPSLAIYFVNDDEGAGQCQRESDVQIVLPGETKSIVIDTDQRAGGCLLQLRLR